MEKPLISIIIPVYNVKEQLTECVNSILEQSYEQYELILVDDGSTDGSSELCDQLAKISSKIHVIHKKNGGVSSARNIGLDTACGEFVVFVYSDDIIYNTYLELFINASTEADLVIGSLQDIYVDGNGCIYKKKVAQT